MASNSVFHWRSMGVSSTICSGIYIGSPLDNTGNPASTYSFPVFSIQCTSSAICVIRGVLVFSICFPVCCPGHGKPWAQICAFTWFSIAWKTIGTWVMLKREMTQTSETSQIDPNIAKTTQNDPDLPLTTQDICTQSFLEHFVYFQKLLNFFLCCRRRFVEFV